MEVLMRPMWSGHIAFGLISIPVSLSSALEASERVSFRMLHRKDHAPIRYKKFCSKEDVEVPNDEIVRGFEVSKGRYTMVEKEELEAAEEEARGDGDGTVEVLQFVPFDSLDSISFDHPYYVWPRKGGERAYAVLRAALSEAQKVGIAKLPLRGRPTLAALLPGTRAIALETLRPFEEIRKPEDLGIRVPAANAGEVKMAKLLIDQLSSDGWEPAEHPNEYRKALRKLLASKARFALTEKKKTAEAADNVVDLMSALKKSLERAKARPSRQSGRRRGAA